MITTVAGTPPGRLERAAYASVLGFAAALQISIVAAEALLAVSAVLWLALVIHNRERIQVPRMFWPLAAYAGLSLVSAALSLDPDVSFRDSKQLLLFAVVPIAYRLLRGARGLMVIDVVITVGALSAALGIIQFGILNFNDLTSRPRGVLGLSMTYSGLLMLVACTAAARVMFRKQDRLWAALVMPALVVAIATTMSRNAWIGACAGIGVLFLIRDFRLIALLPVGLAVFIGFAPKAMSDRLYSTFQTQSARRSSETTTSTVLSNQDRVAMLRTGVRIIKSHALTGVGPDMVIQVYPYYRDPKAVNQLNPHLHNVPLQIAAERGLPALAAWLWFVLVLLRDLFKRRHTSAIPSLATGGLACAVAMLAAGMFEHNFGDSEFLMLFLLLVTLPFAADRLDRPRT